MWPLLFGESGIYVPTYLFIISLVFSFGIYWAYLRSHTFGIDQVKILDVSLAVMIGSFIGARLGHVIIENPVFYLKNPLKIFMFWNGGFVFYGGAIGAFGLGFLACNKLKLNWKSVADLAAPIGALGYAIGRLGCFFAGCCYGVPTNLPWAVHFPEGVEAPPFIGLHPTQIYAFLWELTVFAGLLFLERKGPLRPSGKLFGIWITFHAVGRILMEHFRNDYRGQQLLGLSFSTWISMVLMACGLYLIIESIVDNHLFSPRPKMGRKR